MDGTPSDPSIATLKSSYTGDASIEVSRVSRGTGHRLGGTWYLSLDGEASALIDVGADSEEVWQAISNISSIGNVSVADSVMGEPYNGDRSWIITFHDWNNPNRTATPPVLAVGEEGLKGTRARARLDTTVTGNGETNAASNWCVKAVMQLSSLLSSGNIDECSFVADWRGGATYAVPTFPFDSNSSTLEAALASVDRDVVGKVWVSREGTSGNVGGVWNLTFVENAEGRTPELLCGTDAEVSVLTIASCPAIGGFFALEFEGNRTQDIPYDAPETKVKVAISSFLYMFI